MGGEPIRLVGSSVLRDNGTYPTILPPEFRFGTLHKAACNDESLYDDVALNKQDFLGWTPIHYAVACGSRHVLFNYLLMDRAYVNVQDLRRRTPLHYAYHHDDEEAVIELLQAGADINCRDVDGMTPLHDAAKNGARKVAAALIDGGADMSALDSGGRAPLAWALCSGHADLARELLWDVTSKEQRDNRGRTMLHMAITWGGGMEIDFGDVFGFLVPAIDKDTKDRSGYTPLHLAAAMGYLSAVQWLISQGANPHAHNGLYPEPRVDKVNKHRHNITPLRVAQNRLDMMVRQQAEKEKEAAEWKSHSRVEGACGSDVDKGDGAEQADTLRHQLEVRRLEDVIQYLMAFGNGPDMESCD